MKGFFDDFLNYLGKMRFCKKCGFIVGKPYFLRVQAVKYNRKTDKKSIQQHVRQQSDQKVAKKSDFEEDLASIWGEVSAEN